MFAYVTTTFLCVVTNDVCEPFEGLSMMNIQANEGMVCLGKQGCVQNTNRGTWTRAFGEGAPSQNIPYGPIKHCFSPIQSIESFDQIGLHQDLGQQNFG